MPLPINVNQRFREAVGSIMDPTEQERAIQVAANEKFPDDMAARFQYRNELRQAAGLPPEKRRRGGVAGAWDSGFLPVAAGLVAAPFALGALGGAGAAGAAGSAAAPAGGAIGAAGGAAGAIPAASVAGGGGLLGKLGGLLNSPGGKALTTLGTAGYGIMQQNKANELTKGAIAADQARWAAGAPLRQAGSAGMLNPQVADTSSLQTLGRRGNPFAAIPVGGR